MQEEQRANRQRFPSKLKSNKTIACEYNKMEHKKNDSNQFVIQVQHRNSSQVRRVKCNMANGFQPRKVKCSIYCNLRIPSETLQKDSKQNSKVNRAKVLVKVQQIK